MSYGLFTKSFTKSQALEEVLGESPTLWGKLTAYIRKNGRMEEEL
jgi:hypothetical protein